MRSINMMKYLADGPGPITALLTRVERYHFALGDSKPHPESTARPLNFDSLDAVTREKHRRFSSVGVLAVVA